MDRTEPYVNLRFAQRPRPLLRSRLIPVAVVLTVFSVLWFLVPPSVLYWLLLLLLGVSVWIASYGWRQALRALIALLRRLDNSPNGGLR